MRTKNLALVSAALGILALPFAIATADDSRPPPPRDGKRPPGPPPEAITACKDASAGATCSFTHRDHAITGTCVARPDGTGPLACRPEGPPPPPPSSST